MANVTVEGTVSRINRNGVGFGIRETWTGRDGASKERYWAVWMPGTEPTRVIVGDEVIAVGRLSSKVSPRDARFVDLAVQDAEITITRENGPRTWDLAPDEQEPWEIEAGLAPTHTPW